MTTQSATNILFASKLLTVYGPSSMAQCDYDKPTTQAVLGIVHVN